MTAELEVCGLTKCFGGLTASHQLSFRIGQGEIYGVIGPNGAGKTTLFAMLVGALRPTRGEIYFCGERIDGKSVHEIARRGLVRTHQIVRPFRDMTVYDNVLVGASFGRPLAAGPRSVGIGEILEFTGLDKKARTLAGHLTLGELKRLEMARALAARPRVLCLDEVMGGLNPVEIQQTAALVRRSRDQGITILMIEHHVKAVAEISDRILVLNFGHKIGEGAAREVLADARVIEAYLGDCGKDR